MPADTPYTRSRNICSANVQSNRIGNPPGNMYTDLMNLA